VYVPNFAGVLKSEIRRLARKEAREAVTPLRKLVAALRRRSAQQRKQIAELQRAAKRSTKSMRVAEAPESGGSQIRFSPTWVKRHRKKLKMSRRVYAKLVGVSAQSIFGWESGRTRPRRGALEAWRRIRGMGVRELKELPGVEKADGRTRRARGRKRGRPARRKTARRKIAGRRAKKK
jgi:DNA-binding transcriptional regulator YiaG